MYDACFNALQYRRASRPHYSEGNSIATNYKLERLDRVSVGVLEAPATAVISFAVSWTYEMSSPFSSVHTFFPRFPAALLLASTVSIFLHPLPVSSLLLQLLSLQFRCSFTLLSGSVLCGAVCLEEPSATNEICQKEIPVISNTE